LLRFAAARVARLATTAEGGQPHVVPVVFGLADGVIYTAVDGKPKSGQRLRRLANIEANPRVSVLVDHYDEDWSQLWWVRADGTAVIHRDGAVFHRAIAILRAKYPQYQLFSLDGPVIAIAVERWRSWPETLLDSPAGLNHPAS
jgi:PPOX class probable F420-dependent enzyme